MITGKQVSVPWGELERVEVPSSFAEVSKETINAEVFGAESHHAHLRLAVHKDPSDLTQSRKIMWKGALIIKLKEKAK